MRYSYNQGLQRTWRDYLDGTFNYVRGHNWLPAAVGSITALWLILVFVDAHQSPNPTLGAPSHIAHKAGNSLSVSYKSDNSGTPSVVSASSKSMASGSNDPALQTSDSTLSAAPVADGTGDSSSIPPITDPVTLPITPTLPTPPADGSGDPTDGSSDDGSDGDITVTTPVTDPITVDPTGNDAPVNI